MLSKNQKLSPNEADKAHPQQLSPNKLLVKALQQGDTDLNIFKLTDFRLQRAIGLEIKNLWQIQALSGDIRFYSQFDLSKTDNLGLSVAHYAAWSGRIEALEWVKEHAPFLLKNLTDMGLTIAHYAAWSGKIKALEWVKNNALELLSNEEGSIIYHAVLSRKIEMIDAIAQVTFLDFRTVHSHDSDLNLLHITAFLGFSEILAHLIFKYGLNPKDKTPSGEDLLYWAKSIELDTHVHVFPSEAHRKAWVENIADRESIISLCGNTAYLDELYKSYLSSFHVDETLSTLDIHPVRSIILDYAGAAADSKTTWLQIEKQIEHRNQIVKPLREYCSAHFIEAFENGAKNILCELLSRNLLKREDLAQKLEHCVTSLHKKPYISTLQECIQILKDQEHEELAIQANLQVFNHQIDVNFSHSEQQRTKISHHFQINCLIALASTSALVLAIGIVLLSSSVFIAGTVMTASALITGSCALYGLFKLRKMDVAFEAQPLPNINPYLT